MQSLVGMLENDSRGRVKSTYGFSVHTGVDEHGFIHCQSIPSDNLHDSQERDTLLLGGESALYADAAYSPKETRDKLKRKNHHQAVKVSIAMLCYLFHLHQFV